MFSVSCSKYVTVSSFLPGVRRKSSLPRLETELEFRLPKNQDHLSDHLADNSCCFLKKKRLWGELTHSVIENFALFSTFLFKKKTFELLSFLYRLLKFHSGYLLICSK